MRGVLRFASVYQNRSYGKFARGGWLTENFESCAFLRGQKLRGLVSRSGRLLGGDIPGGLRLPLAACGSAIPNSLLWGKWAIKIGKVALCDFTAAGVRFPRRLSRTRSTSVPARGRAIRRRLARERSGKVFRVRRFGSRLFAIELTFAGRTEPCGAMEKRFQRQ